MGVGQREPVGPVHESEFYTVEELAAVLGVHIQTVRRWIRDGYIAASRPRFPQRGPSSGYRISRDEVERVKGAAL